MRKDWSRSQAVMNTQKAVQILRETKLIQNTYKENRTTPHEKKYLTTRSHFTNTEEKSGKINEKEATIYQFTPIRDFPVNLDQYTPSSVVKHLIFNILGKIDKSLNHEEQSFRRSDPCEVESMKAMSKGCQMQKTAAT